MDGFVGQDVAEHVLGDHDVEVGGAAQEMHRGSIDEQMLDLELGELGAEHARRDVAP